MGQAHECGLTSDGADSAAEPHLALSCPDIAAGVSEVLAECSAVLNANGTVARMTVFGSIREEQRYPTWSLDRLIHAITTNARERSSGFGGERKI
jgi:hypothetical protein